MTPVSMCNWLGVVLFTEIRGSKAEDGVESDAFNHGGLSLSFEYSDSFEMKKLAWEREESN